MYKYYFSQLKYHFSNENICTRPDIWVPWIVIVDSDAVIKTKQQIRRLKQVQGYRQWTWFTFFGFFTTFITNIKVRRSENMLKTSPASVSLIDVLTLCVTERTSFYQCVISVIIHSKQPDRQEPFALLYCNEWKVYIKYYSLNLVSSDLPSNTYKLTMIQFYASDKFSSVTRTKLLNES